MEKKIISISTGTILRIMAIMLAAWFFYVIRDIIILFILSVVLTATIKPIVDWLDLKKIPRSASVITIYVLLMSVLILAFSLLLPPLIGQFKELSLSIPQYAEKLTEAFRGIESYARSYNIDFSSEDLSRNVLSNIFQSSGQLFSTTASIFHGLISFVVVLSLTFYMSVKKNGMRRFIAAVTAPRYQEYALSFSDRVQVKIGRWVFGQLLLMATVFALDLLVLYFTDVPYVLVLALIGGVLEIVPYVGPVIATAIATTVGLLVSPLTGLAVLLLFTGVHQFEVHFIVPQIMKKAVGLNPIIVILALLVGIQIGGVLGAILAVPVATALGMLVNDIMGTSKNPGVAFPK
jgi:predicted PurR-regulated permease PerM